MDMGSVAHRDLFCQAFIATHRRWDPADLAWPDLGRDALDRLRRLPFWGEAVATERETGEKITAYAATVVDPVLREAITLQGIEEVRHAHLLEVMLVRYGIQVTPRPTAPLPRDLEGGFVETGYGECIDSFFAFGLFELARRAVLVPPALLALVEPVIDEEARHIIFFTNWAAYRQRSAARRSVVRRAVRALRYYLRAGRRRLEAVRSASGVGFTASGARAVSVDVSAEAFLATCLAENERRLAGFDPRLLRPRLVPRLARIALVAMRRRR